MVRPAKSLSTVDSSGPISDLENDQLAKELGMSKLISIFGFIFVTLFISGSLQSARAGQVTAEAAVRTLAQNFIDAWNQKQLPEFAVMAWALAKIGDDNRFTFTSENGQCKLCWAVKSVR